MGIENQTNSTENVPEIDKGMSLPSEQQNQQKSRSNSILPSNHGGGVNGLDERVSNPQNSPTDTTEKEVTNENNTSTTKTPKDQQDHESQHSVFETKPYIDTILSNPSTTTNDTIIVKINEEQDVKNIKPEAEEKEQSIFVLLIGLLTGIGIVT